MQPIKSRGALLILIAMVSQSYVIINSAARFMVGRWRYPCFLYSIMFSVVIPFAFLPGVLRMFRLIYIVKLNSLKKFVANIKGTTGNEDENNKHNSVAQVNNHNNNNSNHNMSHTNGFAVFKNRQQQRTFALWKFWVSNKFIVLCFIVSVVIHLGIWGILAGTSSDPALYFSFRSSCGMSSVDSYVIVGQAFVYIGVNLLLLLFAIVKRVEDTWSIRIESVIVLAQWILFFAVFVLIAALWWYFYIQAERYWPYGYFMIMACFIDILFSAWIPLIRSFMIPQKRGSKLEQILTIQDSSGANVEQLKIVLEDTDFKESFRMFCEKSFCPEMLLFWEEAKQYELLKEDYSRRVAAKSILDKYLSVDAPLELNLPNKQIFIPEITDAINQYEATLLQGVYVGTNILTEMGTNIALYVFNKEAAHHKENFLSRMTNIATSEEQIIAEAVQRYQSILLDAKKDEDHEDKGVEDEAIECTHEVSTSHEEDTHSATDQMSTHTTTTSTNPNSSTPSKRKATVAKIRKKLKRPQSTRNLLESKNEKKVENKLPDTLFHRLILHTELDMMDIFARYRNTRPFRKHMDRLREEVKLKDIVVA